MEKIAVWSFRWAPPLRQGWCATSACLALAEFGLPYEARLIGFPDLGSDAYRQREFSTKEAVDMDVGWANTLDAFEVFVAQPRIVAGEKS